MFIGEDLVEVFVGARDFVEHAWVFAAFHPGGLVGKVVEGEAAAGLAAAHDSAGAVGCGAVGCRVAEAAHDGGPGAHGSGDDSPFPTGGADGTFTGDGQFHPVVVFYGDVVVVAVDFRGVAHLGQEVVECGFDGGI